MKRIILITFFFLGISCFVMGAIQNRLYVRLNSTTLNGKKVKKPKSITILPIDVFVDGKQLDVSFSESMTVEVIVRSVQNDEIVYSSVLTTQAFMDTFIPLADSEAGEYEVKFVYNDLVLTGAFDLQ